MTDGIRARGWWGGRAQAKNIIPTVDTFDRRYDVLVILIDAHPQHGLLMGPVQKRLREELAALQVEMNAPKPWTIACSYGASTAQMVEPDRTNKVFLSAI